VKTGRSEKAIGPTDEGEKGKETNIKPPRGNADSNIHRNAQGHINVHNFSNGTKAKRVSGKVANYRPERKIKIVQGTGNWHFT